GGAGHDGHRREHAVLEHGAAVHGVEAAEVVEAPLGEVPPALVGQLVGGDATFVGDDLAERGGVVAAHAVEVDPEDERRLQKPAPMKSSAASMNPKSFGVAK